MNSIYFLPPSLNPHIDFFEHANALADEYAVLCEAANDYADAYAELCDLANELVDLYPVAPREPGVYYTPTGEIYQLRREKKTGRLKARKYNESTKCFRGCFNYERFVKAADRLTLEQLIELSLTIDICLMCGRTLTAEQSAKRSLGPICEKNYRAAEAQI